MEIELRHARYFVAVAEERHFGLAARRLHISQPPLSRQIHNLEEEIGAQLIDRSTRPIRLTEAGSAFLEEARSLLEQSRRAIDRSRRTALGEHGHLAIAGLPWSYGETLPLTLRAFGERFRDVRLELSIQEAVDQADAVEKQWIDVGFTRPVIETRAIRVEPLLEEKVVAILPARHPLAEQAQISLQELVQEPFVAIAEQVVPGFASHQATELSRRGLTPQIAHEAPDPASQLALVAAGLGVGLHLTARANRCERGVAFVPIDGDSPTVPLALLWRRDDSRGLVHSFLHTARELAGQLATTE